MTKILRSLVVVVMLVAGAPALIGGCASRQERQVVRPIEPRSPAQTRVAVPIEEERHWYENTGEVVLIVVGGLVLIGLAVLPIILLTSD